MAKADKETKEKVELVRMKGPKGSGNIGIPDGEEVLQLSPDKKGFLEVPRHLVNALIAQGYTHAPLEDETEK